MVDTDTERTSQAEIQEIPFLCPIPRCGGWVSYVNDLPDSPPFYGCGECARVWFERATLENDITAAISANPYRNAAYIPLDMGGWAPVKYSDIPKELLISIDSEPEPTSARKRSIKSKTRSLIKEVNL